MCFMPRREWLIVAVLLGSACTDTQYVTAPPFTEPPAAAQGFLGYTDQTSQKPVCGNCHVGKLEEWQGTDHSHAWADLQASGHATASCDGCHTVNGNGNKVQDPNAGFLAAQDPRYQDVQCESCHGPGLEHVTNPDASQPLASILAGVDLTYGCGECHQGAHQPFVEEWSQSMHAAPNEHAQSNAACVQCHEARGILDAWGETDANYLEKDGTDPISITCAVCHDPHDATNDKQLRYPVNVASLEGNLCMRCHQRQAVPNPTSSHPDPHSPEGPLLLGQAGWLPPDFPLPSDKIIGTHGSEANEDLCATCHVHAADITDPTTGDFVFHSTGHLFEPTPCLDDKGIPTAGDDCTEAQRSFASCTASGCHGSQDAARSAFAVATNRIEALVATVNALLDQVPASEFAVDGVETTAEGARFNAELGALPGSPVHNPFFMEALLTATIKQVEQDYGVKASPALSLQNVLGTR